MIIGIALILILVAIEVILIDIQCKVDALMEFFDLEKKRISEIWKK